jgi:hypothetical protein
MKFVGKRIVDSQSMFSFVEIFHHLPTKKKKKKKVSQSPQGFFWKKLHKITIFQESFSQIAIFRH